MSADAIRSVTIACLIYLPAHATAGEPAGRLQAERLMCEYRANPLGVDSPEPELSWIVTCEEQGGQQTAYQVLVASSLESLNRQEGDLWDSQKTIGCQTFGIKYAGARLSSHQECFWKVRVWGADGAPGEWSEVARWSVGILTQPEWKAGWIGYDGDRHLVDDPPAASLHGARWICHDGDQGPKGAAAARVFLFAWSFPDSFDADEARLTVCADDQSVVLVNDEEVATTSDTFQPVTEEVGAYLRPGRNTVRVWCRNNTDGWTGICVKISVRAKSGDRYIIATDERWRSLPEGDGPWETLSFVDAGHVHSQGPFGVDPWGLPSNRRDLTASPRHLRGSFEVRQPVARAMAYVAALGCADVTLNGMVVNEDYFSSGWTDYRQRVYYRAYDITDLVRHGENICGATLADGWYSGHVGWGARRDVYGKNPRFSTVFYFEYADGQTEVIGTDGSWVAVRGPKQVADFLVGEEYDATATTIGWDKPNADFQLLGSVDVGAEVSPVVQWHPGPPVVEVAEFPAQSLRNTSPGVYVFDLGQNFAGVARIKIRGRKGQRIKVRYAERLNEDGTLYTRNLRLARTQDFYTCNGDGEETWQPRQTFHGFQYVELSDLDEAPSLDAVVGVALSSDTPIVSEFSCSDAKLNRLFKNILWTQRANFIDLPTDCPQRDERLGWTGDAQVYINTACRVADTQAFFRKWLRDLADAQREDGQLPRVAPVIPGEDDGGPAWADAGVICPWELYQAYGDRTLLERQYESMVRFVEFCRRRSRGEVLPPANYHTFGDWLSVDADTPRDVIYMAYYARSVELLARSAGELGRRLDCDRYTALHNRIKAAFVETYVDADGKVAGDTQCAYVLAIAYGLVDGDLRLKAADRLVDDLEDRGWRLSTGFIGTKDLMLALEKIGRNDVALRLLHQQEYPGWMFSITHGATSIWERWDGWTPDRGFQDPGMNSFAHYSFGAVYGWMFENLGGIRNTEPGFGKFIIQPTFDPKLDHCRVFYDSIRGPIETEWRNESARRDYRIRIPANTTATLRLKGINPAQVALESGPLATAGLTCRSESDAAGVTVSVVPLPSGEYRFVLPATP